MYKQKYFHNSSDDTSILNKNNHPISKNILDNTFILYEHYDESKSASKTDFDDIYESYYFCYETGIVFDIINYYIKHDISLLESN